MTAYVEHPKRSISGGVAGSGVPYFARIAGVAEGRIASAVGKHNPYRSCCESLLSQIEWRPFEATGDAIADPPEGTTMVWPSRLGADPLDSFRPVA